MIDIVTQKYAIYFSAKHIAFGDLVEFYVGGLIRLPKWINDLITVGNFLLNCGVDLQS